MALFINFDDLTNKEKEALKQLDKAMKTLSKRHWFYACSSGLCIMRITGDDDMMLPSRGVNPEYKAAEISGYGIDGGDW